MRAGLSGGPVPYDIEAVDDRVAREVADLGFSGLHVHFGYGEIDGPTAPSPDACERAREVFARQGVRIAQFWGFDPRLVEADPEARRGEVARLRKALRVAADLGADMVVTGSGSLNPRGAYWPHRGNHSPAARERLVDSLRQVAATAEDLGVSIALEAHLATALKSPEATREVIDAVGSKAVRANLDPKNFLGDLWSLWNYEAIVDRVFDALGDVAIAGDVNDAYAEDRLVVHISETVLGDGELDLQAYLRRFEALLPDAYLVVEHLPAGLVAQAKRVLDEHLAELGISWR